MSKSRLAGLFLFHKIDERRIFFFLRHLSGEFSCMQDGKIEKRPGQGEYVPVVFGPAEADQNITKSTMAQLACQQCGSEFYAVIAGLWTQRQPVFTTDIGGVPCDYYALQLPNLADAWNMQSRIGAANVIVPLSSLKENLLLKSAAAVERPHAMPMMKHHFDGLNNCLTVLKF